MMWPKYRTLVIPKSPLGSLAYNSCSSMMLKISSTCLRWPSHVLLYINKSSKKTSRNFLNCLLNIWFIQDWKVADTLVNPKGMTRNYNVHSGIWKLSCVYYIPSCWFDSIQSPDQSWWTTLCHEAHLSWEWYTCFWWFYCSKPCSQYTCTTKLIQ